MHASRSAGRSTAPVELLIDVDCPGTGVSRAACRTFPTPRTARFCSGRAAIGARRSTAHSPKLASTFSQSRRQFAITAIYAGHRRPALSGQSTRTRFRARRATHRALEVLAANGVETVLQRDDGVTPTPVLSRAILGHKRDPNARARGRHCDPPRRRTTRLQTVDSNTTRRTAARPIPTSHPGFKIAPTTCCAAAIAK